jgi:hypothetical protein
MKHSQTSVFTESPSSPSRIQRRATFVSDAFLMKLVVIHILYMKSTEKALSRNYNAQELELFCHNRFYGPLVVAYNMNRWRTLRARGHAGKRSYGSSFNNATFAES